MSTDSTTIQVQNKDQTLSITDEAMLTLCERFHKSTDGILEQLAAQHGLSLKQVITCLPAENVRHIEGKHFVPVMKQLTEWGNMTLIVHTNDIIMEFKGEIPEGAVGRGFYNLVGGEHLSGHLRHQNCADIFLVERQFMNRDTAAVMFMNNEGGCMFKVFLGRDAQGQLDAEQLPRFRELSAVIAELSQSGEQDS